MSTHHEAAWNLLPKLAAKLRLECPDGWEPSESPLLAARCRMQRLLSKGPGALNVDPNPKALKNKVQTKDNKAMSGKI